MDVEGYDFAFAGSVAKLIDLTYTYTTKDGVEKTLQVPEFTKDVTGYNMVIGSEINSNLGVKLTGEALNTGGNEEVVDILCHINEYGFATGEVSVKTNVATKYYNTIEITAYDVNISAPAPYLKITKLTVSDKSGKAYVGNKISINATIKSGPNKVK